jgi:hypothetical protein
MNYSAREDPSGSTTWLANLKEAFWHTIAYTLNIDIFVVNSASARIVVVAYCFLVRSLKPVWNTNCQNRTDISFQESRYNLLHL